jgi:hypothetical protein
VSHEGPTQGFQYSLLMEWENGEITKDPLGIIAVDDDPATCAIYARENGILDQPGWKKFTHMVNQAKL